ncbi:hypothetical protein [uncultured Friedmanniella sp.]|uniref:hypothetical protein n=1 Tax=uncultured Friedmanniella sp. TaxID=335381 RepID=UPI0035C97392
MAHRRRALEQATFRRAVVDRIVVLVLAVVAASGLMSILPSQTQVAVSRLGCRAVSLGLGSCGAPGLDLQDTQLGQARCPALATLDAALPEVRVRELTAAQGIPVRISTERSGDVFVQLGSSAQPAPPALLQGQVRPSRDVIDGVQVPAQAEWYLPRGQGLEQLLVAVQDGHHTYVQQHSALGLVSRVLRRRGRDVAPPSLLFSQVDLGGRAWPGVRAASAPPRRRAPGQSTPGPVAVASSVTLQTSTPAVSTYNRVTHEAAVVAPVLGQLGARPVTGAMRWVRDDQGTVMSVLIAVVSPGALSPGEPATAAENPGVAYIAIPVSTAPERALVQSWLSGPGPVVVPLDELLGLRAPSANDQLGSFLTRAVTITVLHESGVGVADLQERVTTELQQLRRQEWPGTRIVSAGTIAPQPSGGQRRVLADPGCTT